MWEYQEPAAFQHIGRARIIDLNTQVRVVEIVQNVNARGTIYSMWIILRKCEGGCEARLVRSIEQIW